MFDFTIEIMQQCTNNSRHENINGHECSVYSNGFEECDCADFQYRKKQLQQDCKHIKQLKEKCCYWHEMYGEAQTAEQKEKHICPVCGSPTISVKVAV